MKFVPHGNRVLVLPEQAAEETEEGIYIPKGARQEKHCGNVIAMSSSVTDSALKPGMRVHYNRFAGEKIEIEGVTYLLMEPDEIMGFDRE